MPDLLPLRYIYELTLDDFPDNARTRFGYLSHEKRLANGENLHTPGDIAQNIFHIRVGSICFFASDNTDAKPLGLLGPGAVFGEVSLLAGQPRPFLAVANGHTVLDVLQAKAFKRLARDFPDLQSLVTDRLSNKLIWALSMSQAD